LWLIGQASAALAVTNSVSSQSFLFQPALLEFILPAGFSRLWGVRVMEILQIAQQVETAVSLSWVGLLLSIVAIRQGGQRARWWFLLLLLYVLFAIGPTVKITPNYTLPIKMPYAFFTSLPGLGFIRTPGRFMLMAQVALALTAGIGLQAIVKRSPRYQAVIWAGAFILLLIESWPLAWPQEALLAPPPFYQQIATDQDEYGVLDLPVLPTPYNWQINYGSFYQMYQMTHRKGIAYGYISRTYEAHPLFPCFIPETTYPQPDVLVNHQPVDCYQNLRAILAYYNYRYVVWHKPQPWSPWGYQPGSWGEQNSAELVQSLFGQERPVWEDEMTVVYRVMPVEPKPPETQMGLLKNWYDNEGELRWATSPAQLFVVSPENQQVTLQITPAMMFQPDSATGWHVGNSGRLTVDLDNNQVASLVEIQSDQSFIIPLELSPGLHIITLSLAAGSFYPPDYSVTEDQRHLSFAIRSINLQTDD
jgi:hypothetical protein